MSLHNILFFIAFLNFISVSEYAQGVEETDLKSKRKKGLFYRGPEVGQPISERAGDSDGERSSDYAKDEEPDYLPEEEDSGAESHASSSKYSVANEDDGEDRTGPVVKRARTPSNIKIHGGLGVSSSAFSAQIGLLYPIEWFLGIDTSAFFWSESDRVHDESYRGTGWGPEMAAILHYPNPTIFTPYLAGGFGYENWTQEWGGEEYDNNSSVYGVYYFGASVRLGKNFAMSLQRRTKQYTQKTPLDKAGERERDNPQHATEIGFQVMF